jgi:hypothetical protein
MVLLELLDKETVVEMLRHKVVQLQRVQEVEVEQEHQVEMFLITRQVAAMVALAWHHLIQDHQ